jgi:hypothetical protein
MDQKVVFNRKPRSVRLFHARVRTQAANHCCRLADAPSGVFEATVKHRKQTHMLCYSVMIRPRQKPNMSKPALHSTRFGWGVHGRGLRWQPES